MMRRRLLRERAGMTLIELLNVIVISVLLFATLGVGGATNLLEADASGDVSAGMAAMFGGGLPWLS